jgi:hypothetical protein
MAGRVVRAADGFVFAEATGHFMAAADQPAGASQAG